MSVWHSGYQMHGHISGLQLGIHIHLTEKKKKKKRQAVRHLQICKPLHPNLSIHIFHTILYCFGLGTEKENFLGNQSFLG